MTSPEHTLVGIHAAFALGCHRHFGWPVVAMAGLASNLPDWDGLPMLIDMQRFEAGHRVWGHNFVAILLASLVLAWSQRRFRWIERTWHRARHILPVETQTATPPSPSGPASAMVFATVAFVAQVIHLPCDMVVSGGEGLSDWHIQPFWPFSDAGFVFPLIPWGDVGPTIILMAGVIVIAKNPTRISTISVSTLVALLAYLLLRGWARGILPASPELF